jgi:hypothetical protein
MHVPGLNASMSAWPEWFDNRPCECLECSPGPGIDFREKERQRQMRFMDDRIRMFLEDGWSIVSENGTGETEY